MNGAPPLGLHPDRLFPAEPGTREQARWLYERIRALPIVSPHGHTDPAWFADNTPFPDPAQLLIVPDHYLFRMLYSQGIPLEDLGVPRRDGGPVETDARSIWRRFAEHYHLFRATPSRLWLDHALCEVFGVRERLGPESAERIYEHVAGCLAREEFRPRALFDRFGIEVLTTTESPLDPLQHHRAIEESGWNGRVIPSFRPDPVVDPEHEGFVEGILQLGELTGEDSTSWRGYLQALSVRREQFRCMGATSTDHGHPSARTADLDPGHCERLFGNALRGAISAQEAELFRGQMLTEMARMSLDDGLVLQIHPGSTRNHNRRIFARFGPNVGADIPAPTDYVEALRPLLDRFGNEPGLTVVVFTLDESTYSRELAPLAGHYPILKLGPAWWFFDSPEGIWRYRRSVTETAGFYNTVGFNDDTRAFLSIPARHDLARRVDCAYLATLVAEHRLEHNEAEEIAVELAYGLAKRTYRL